MGGLIQDLRFALRTLRRTPGFFVAAVATIALAIGAGTAILTAVDRIVLRPLPFPDSERAVVICETSARTADFCVASPANVADWGRSVAALETIGVARSESAEIALAGRRIVVPGGIASPGFFRSLGIQPVEGRLFDDADLNEARNQVVVISDAFWRDRLDARPNVVGTTLTLNGRAFQIVGRLPPAAYVPSFDFVQVWKPLTASVDDTSKRSWRGFLTVGRLARGATLDDLRVQLETVRGRLAAVYPESNAGWGLRTTSLREYVVGATSTTLWIFLAAVGLVLVIACANVAGLLLVRGSTRQPEFALRTALGAGRLRVVRQLLTESGVIAAAGGAGGWLVGLAFTRALVRLAPASIPRLEEVAIDGRIALLTFGLTAITALAFGLAPARAATTRSRLAAGLKLNRQSDAASSRAHSVLIVAELGISVLLLLTAAVLTRSFTQLAGWAPGFDRSTVAVAWAIVPPAPGRSTQSAVAVLERAREGIAGVPGVTSVGLGSAGPLFGGTETGAVAIGGRASTPDQSLVVNWHDVDSGYFSTLGRRVVKGRDLSPADVEGAPAVAVVNETFASRVLHGEDPLGRRVTVQNHPADIVGVVSDVRPVRPDVAIPAEVFWPIRQYPRFGAYLVVRTAPGAAGVERAIRARIQSTDSSISVGTFTPLDRQFERELVSPRFNMILIGAFALVAIVLAAVGVYGLIAASVAARTREIGVRMALGATASGLVRAIVMRVLRLALLGMLAGVAASLLVSRVLAGFAAGVGPTDPVVLIATLGGFLIVTAAAGYIPARRASRIDPLLALRTE